LTIMVAVAERLTPDDIKAIRNGSFPTAKSAANSAEFHRQAAIDRKAKAAVAATTLQIPEPTPRAAMRL
jgi:hypothetical protein